MVEIDQIVSGIKDFGSWEHVKKIKLFGWYLHAIENKDRFAAADVRGLYERLAEEKPKNISGLLDQLGRKTRKEVLKDSRGYFLTREMRSQHDAKYSNRPGAIYVDKLLRELPTKLPSLTERTYLDESIACFNAGAFRGAVIMAWNLAYDHLCEYVLAAHRVAFNTQLPKSFPKADVTAVGRREDFHELKESQVLTVCKSASILSDSLYKVMKEKLERRNIAAHPSGIVTSQATAEHFIVDLIENAVLRLV